MKAEMSKHGPRYDYRGAHVRLPFGGRILLGEVERCYYEEYGCSGFRFTVRHFNGEPWPIEPSVYAVDILEREHVVE